MEEQKRKISIRKILQAILTVVVSVCCVIAMVSASNIEGSKYLSSVAVHIRNDKKYHFIQEKEIMDLAINNRHVDVMHTQLSQLDVHGIEQVIKSDPWVAQAQAYIDIDRVLHMYVVQRIPVARIFEKDSSYYMDATLHTMPLSATNIYYTMVVTNVPDLRTDSTGLKGRIYSLVKTIEADTFWNAQISQVIVDSLGTFELMPVIGNQKIIFGDTTDKRQKLDNLFAFYKNVLNRIGWDKYETLDLRFEGQVIASPSLPYKGPVDRVVDKMNWINSIIITEAQNDTKDSIKLSDIKGTDVAGTAAAKPANAKLAIAKTAQGKSATGTVVKAAAVAGGVGAGILLAKQLKKNSAKDKANEKKDTRFVLKSRQKHGVKPPSAPFGKGTIKAQPVKNTKAGKNEKAGDKKKQTVKAADKKKGKTIAKKTAAKPVPKKGIKHVDTKKLKKVNKDKNKKQAKPEKNNTGNKKH